MTCDGAYSSTCGINILNNLFFKKLKKFKSANHELKDFVILHDVLQSGSNIYWIWHHFQPVLQFSSSWQVHKSCWDVSFLASFWSGTHWYLSLGGVWMWNFQHVKFDLVVCLSDTNRSLKFNWAWCGMGCPYGKIGVKVCIQYFKVDICNWL